MLGSLTGMINKIKDNKMVQNIAGNISQNYSKIKDQVLPKYQITEVIPQIYHIGFPDKEYISQLKAHIAQSQFQVWNISEYQYSKDIQKSILNVDELGQINHLCFSMYSNPPFYQLILAINNIHSFIQCNKNNKVYVHCQDNRIRSAILLSCYLFKHKVEDISQAILLVNKALRVNIQDEGKKKTFKNLHILFKNFVNYNNNPHIIYKQKLKLIKLIVNNPPSLKINNQNICVNGSIRVCIQIKCGEQTIIKQTYSGGIVESNLMCAVFSKDVVVGDQFLVIVKYLHEGKAYNMFRVQLNTNFIYQCFARIYQQDIDSSSFAWSNAELMHIDFIFQTQPESSKLALLYPQHSISKEQTVNDTKEVKEQKKKSEILLQNQKLQSRLSLPTHNSDKQIDDKIQYLKGVVGSQLVGQQQQQQQQDLQDYLSKLQSQA